MALIKTSNEIVSIRGRLGGVYFKTGKDGKHVQAMPRFWNYTRSPAQQGVWRVDPNFGGFGIGGFSGAAWLWMLALLAFYGAAWAAFGIAYLFYKKGKEPKHITGYNWYIYYALIFPETERPPFWKPPHSPGDLPHYVTTFQGIHMYEHAPPDWPDYSPSGYYWPGLEWNGQPSYRTDDLMWFVWFKDGVWRVTPGLDFEPPDKTYLRTALENHGSITGYYKNPITNRRCHVYPGRAELE